MNFHPELIKAKEMKTMVFLVLLLGFTQCAFPRSVLDSYPPTAEQETQNKLEEMQQQLQQAEFERQSEKKDRENAAKEAADDARQEAEERAREADEQAEERAREAAEQAEQAAIERRNEMIRSAVRTKNNLYFGVLLLLIGASVTSIIKKNNRGELMDENQKYGVIIIISSFLLMLLVLMVSDGWMPEFDYLENLMNMLQIQLIQIKTESATALLGFDYSYLINIPSKYVVLILLSAAAYGFTTYLGITPAIRPWKKAKAE